MLDQEQKTATPAPPRGPERLGRYELVATIGEGALAEVHLARPIGGVNFQRPVVAVKKIHAHLVRQKPFITTLLDEARVSALIKHPRVIDIFDVGVSRGVYFIAMEYLIGQPLQALLERSGAGAGELDVYSAARIVADAAEGLHAAHTLRSLSGRPLDLVHREISPKSIVVLHDGSVKLVDFGFARARARIGEAEAAEASEQAEPPVELPAYSAPEQLGSGAVDRRADVFALGVVLWEALACRRLFDASTEPGRLKQIMQGATRAPSAHRPEVPYELDRICMRAVNVDRAQRFQTAGEMQSAIETFLHDAGFRRETGTVASFMKHAFAAEREAQEALVRKASEPEPARGERRAGGLFPRREEESEGDTAVQTMVRLPGEGTGTAIARGSQNMQPLPVVPRPPPSSSSSPRPLVPRPEPSSREAPAIRAKASAAGPAVAPLGTADVTEPARAARGSTPPKSKSKPRGKGRTGRIESIADAWSDRMRNPSNRALPLPAPPKASADAEADAGVTTSVGPEIEDEDDDFTVVDPEKSPRSFEGTAKTEAAPESVSDESSTPILTGNSSRRIWAAGLVTVAAIGLVGALLYAALGGSGAKRLEAQSVAERMAEAAGGAVSPEPGMGSSGSATGSGSENVSSGAGSVAPAAPSSGAAAGSGSVAQSQPGPGLGSRPEADAASVPGAKPEPAKREPRRVRSGARKVAAARRPAGNPDDLYREGARLYLAGDLDLARRKFHTALQISPRYAPAYRGLGLVHERAGDEARAIRALQTYLRLSPDARDADMVRARIERMRR